MELDLSGSMGAIVATVILGAAGFWLILPGAGARGRIAGAVIAASALGLLASQLPGLATFWKQGLYYVLAGATVVSAAAAVSLRSPLRCVQWFALTLFGTAGLFLLQGNSYPAVAAIVVYAGAILMALLFALMPADSSGQASCDRTSWEGMLSAACGMILIGVLATGAGAMLAGEAAGPPPTAPGDVPGADGALHTPHAGKLPMLHNYLVLGATLLGVGVVGFLSRRNIVLVFLATQIMLLGISLNLAASGRFHNDFDGQMFVILVTVLAACEAAIAVALIRMLFRASGSLDVAIWQSLQGATGLIPFYAAGMVLGLLMLLAAVMLGGGWREP